MVDRLLASPHYGERWGRYWLDVARYADTKGYVFFQDAELPLGLYLPRLRHPRRSTDDLPYDRFILEQLAADRLPTGRTTRRPLAALGFLTLGGRFMNNFHDIIDDRIDVVCRGLHGLTVTCARCHDHKFDPIPTQDYYSLYGVFASCARADDPAEAGEPPRTAVVREVREGAGRPASRSWPSSSRPSTRELVDGGEAGARREYLLAAQQALDQPTTEDFMLLADGTDLNPAMLVRWQVYLARTRKAHDPVFAPWHALAALPPREFAARGRALIARLREGGRSSRSGQPASIAAALVERPPAIAGRGGADLRPRLLNRRRALWQDAARRAALDGRAPGPLPVPALEELRRVFHGPDSPADVPLDPFGELALLPDRPSQAKLQELRNAVAEMADHGPRCAAAGDGAGGLADAGRAARLPPRQSQQPGRARAAPVPRAALGPDRRAVPRRQRPARAGPGDRRPGQPADGPGAGQPRLDAPLRHAAGRDAERLRPAERAAHAPRAARPPGLALHGRRLVDQGAASPDHALGDLSASEATTGPSARAIDPENALLLADEPPPARLRGDPRRPAGGLRPARRPPRRSADARI